MHSRGQLSQDKRNATANLLSPYDMRLPQTKQPMTTKHSRAADGTFSSSKFKQTSSSQVKLRDNQKRRMLQKSNTAAVGLQESSNLAEKYMNASDENLDD